MCPAMSELPIIWQSSGSEYEEARLDRVFNLRRPDRYPVAVVKASDEDHVLQAVKLAIEKKCRVSVRSGGHSWPVLSIRENSVLIDLGNLSEMVLDESTGVVQVSPSTTSGELNAFLLEKGRFFAGGHCPDVGLGGFLLQGGAGWNTRGWGWACEQITAIDLVTAEGQCLRADHSQNTDLLWAARGCGPGFPGLITRFHLQTRLAPKVMCQSVYAYSSDRYSEVFSWLLKIIQTFDRDTEVVLLSSYPPGSPQPALTAVFLAFKDTEDDARTALSQAESSSPPSPVVHLFCKETSLAEQYSLQAHGNPSGHRYYCDNAFINNDAELVPLLEKALTALPSKETYVFWYPLETRSGVPEMAQSLQTDHYLALYGIWKDAKDDTSCIEWVREVIDGVKMHSPGSYLGDIDLQTRTTKFWGNEEGERLMKIRRRWDPNGLFCGYLDAGDRSGAAGLDNLLDQK